MTDYRSAHARTDAPDEAVLDHLAPTRGAYDLAQAILDRHVTSSGSGRCTECGQFGPCERREGAIKVMARYLWLPARKPGASKPELIRARRIEIHRA
jgi:hypothetical protein